MPLSRILIANRGEIALRIVRACHDADLVAVAVYSEEDRHAPYVRLADAAYYLGGAGAANTYLNQDKLLEIARRAHADAVHPGYGFLAESAQFAKAVEQAGLVWIGPPAQAIELLGNKTRARQLAAAVGAPLVPG
ncbi:MAG: acetyl-/propionyl-CoA carboxylase subunit alpha, partial [Bifidobacteriaceae bacterium]|nr:acetyl-/propionyl-CoA carboxylase subunit alpha [Bifidobacteriaceae bacterium]